MAGPQAPPTPPTRPHKRMDLVNVLRAVCSVIGSNKFQEVARVKLVFPRRPLSSDARCNTPRRFAIGRLIETSGSVAMRGYSHLSDEEREQIGLLKVLGHSIGAIARAIGRPKSTISRGLSRNRLPSGRYSPLHAAGAYQLRRRREALGSCAIRMKRLALSYENGTSFLWNI